MEDLKILGNECLKSGKIEEAIECYSKAIDIEPTAALYSNRSSAYLKLQKYFEADFDAREAIKQNKFWSKGYFRYGEVRNSVGQYEAAIVAYETAQELHKAENGKMELDPTLAIRLLQARINLDRQMKYTRNMPWVCAGVGLIIAVIIIASDYALAKTPVITHVVLQSLFVMVFSGIGGGSGKVWMWYSHHLRTTKLHPTEQQEQQLNGGGGEEPSGGGGEGDDDGGGEGGAAPPPRQQHPRYTKAQARLRFKKGKS